MPVMAKTTLNSKNPSTVAKKVSGTGGGILGGQGSSEVVCPLQNADGSVCRKKCIGVSLEQFFPISSSLNSPEGDLWTKRELRRGEDGNCF